MGADDGEQLEKGNERQRTMDAYNLDDYDPGRTAGFYQMPLLRKCTEVPAELVGFNYMLTTDPRPGLGIHFYVDDYQFERVWNDPGQYCERLALHKMELDLAIQNNDGKDAKNLIEERLQWEEEAMAEAAEEEAEEE